MMQQLKHSESSVLCDGN